MRTLVNSFLVVLFMVFTSASPVVAQWKDVGITNGTLVSVDIDSIRVNEKNFTTGMVLQLKPAYAAGREIFLKAGYTHLNMLLFIDFHEQYLHAQSLAGITKDGRAVAMGNILNQDPQLFHTLHVFIAQYIQENRDASLYKKFVADIGIPQ